MGQISGVLITDFIRGVRDGEEFLIRSTDYVALVANGLAFDPVGAADAALVSAMEYTDLLADATASALATKSPIVGSTSIVTVGTITTGTWNGTSIADGSIASALTGKTYNGVNLTAAGSAVKYLNEAGSYVTITGGGTGDVVGPASAVNNRVVFFDGTTGKLIKDSGITLSGSNTGDQTISITGDVTAAGSAGALSATVTKINGTSLAGLATGILKNTTTTGVPSIAVAGDFPTLNQSTTGSAATLTTSRNIQGVAFNGSSNIDIINGTGFVKVTGTTLSYDNSTYLTTTSAASTYQPLDGDLTAIAALTATTDNFIVSVASAWASRTPAQVKTTLSLNLVENTALSTWTGASTITTLGTIGTGTWNATVIADGKIASALTGKTYNGVTLTTAGSATKYLNEAGAYVTITGGTGDVVGPGVAVNNNVVFFSGTTGKIIKDSGLALSGSNTGDQTISITGDVTAAGSTGALAATVTKINGVSLAGLATGILKNTTTSGAPSIAVAGDFPTLNQSTTGSAATLTTSRSIGGAAFNGSADITPLNTTIANEAASTTCFPLFVTAATGNLQAKTNASFTFNSTTGALGATTFIGALTGTASGNYVVGAALGTPLSGTLTNCTFPTLNQNTSGTAANLSGTPALPNGTTATTQAAADNSTKLSTTAYVDTGLALKANLASPTFTGTVTLPASTSFTTPVIGAATGTSLAATGAITSSGGGVGYATGAGGTTSQATSRVTTVVLNKLCGTFTMFSSAVAAAASSTFTFTNSFIAVGDTVIVTHNSTTNACSWICEAIAGAGSATVVVKNVSAASITEATPLKFIVLKAVTA